MLIRLNKFLADSGCCSRRKADEHISAGDIEINGNVVRELGTKVESEQDTVKFKGSVVTKPSEQVYYALNKPRGVISTASDEQGRPTVVDLVPSEPRVYPVGRLDEDSEGLIILTNDGDLAQQLTHPSFEHEKEYSVFVQSRESRVQGIDQIAKKLTMGMRIDGVRMKADRVNVSLDPLNPKRLTLNIVLHTGYNRQIRKMCDKMGLEVETLRRIRIGKLSLDRLNISSGKYTKINKNQIL